MEHVYSRGLKEIVLGSKESLKGNFGKTALHCCIVKGHIIFIMTCQLEDFPRGEVPEPWEKGENWVSYYVADDGEGGEALFLNGCVIRGDLPLRMFQNIIEHWPSDPNTQMKSFM